MARKKTTETGSAAVLATIEAGASEALPRDPARAVAQLTIGDTGDDDDSEPDAQTAPAGGTEPARARRPRARRPSDDTPRVRRSGGRESREQLQARADAAEAKLAAIASPDSPEGRRQLQELSSTIAGAVQMVTAMYIRGKPEREGWRWTDDEAKQWGDMWAGPLLPYFPALGTAAPWVLALFGTAQLAMAKASQAREVASRVKIAPESAPASEEGTTSNA